MSTAILIFQAVMIIGGTGFMLIGAYGLLRLPDVYCRAHALGKAMTFGISLLLLGLAPSLLARDAGVKLFLAFAFQFATIPVASHLIALLSYRRGIRGQSSPEA
jgi:multicomponent Na+:H+ antiporter subunit G